MKSRIWTFLFLLLLPIISLAQKEANIWYFGTKAGLDFSYSPPKVLLDGALRSHEGSAIMADKNGDLLFYTNGETVWNKYHQVMENGTELGGHSSARQSSVIVPKPGDAGLHYLFTMDANENRYENGLMFSVIDINENNGLGKVVEKGTKLHHPGSEGLSATGSCLDGEAQEYWVLAGNVDQPEKVYAYKVDSSGVHKEPVISSFSVKKSINYIKFSPTASKLVLVDDMLNNDDQDRQIIIADFDFSTGLIFNPYYVSVKRSFYFTQAEFSPNGKYLYISDGTQILQINLSENYRITSSLEIETEKHEFQLGPDGNIYIATNKTFLSAILRPNEAGLKGKYRENYIDLKGRSVSIGLPNFVRSYFYNGLNPDAGKDTLLCSSQPLTLGTPAENGTSYQWYPAENLSADNISQPVFQFQNTTDTIQEFEYILTAYNEVCAKKDTIRIQVLPAPPEVIIGSRSVCPGVEGTEYKVPEKESYSYQWEVEGGVIVSGKESATMVADWGPANPEARVRLLSMDSFGCQESVLELPVRINVELETETPRGPSEVCANQQQDVNYFVTNTNGSVYTWGISGGMIKTGQGSHQVSIDWNGTGIHQLWLQERSVTKDTICFGVSDTLKVLVFEDTTSIALDYVSINFEDEKQADIKGNKLQNALASGMFFLFRREWGSEAWEQAGEFLSGDFFFSDGPLSSDEVSYEYKISSQNPCNQEISSLPHRTILLKGKADNETDQVILEWNHYQGWKEGVEEYEVWRRIDEDTVYHLFAVAGTQTEYFSESGKDGFEHHYRVKAKEAGTSQTSWSNEISLRFQHELKIPNVFTPNGDEFNQTFEIPKLEMYPDNELTIYNRWGTVVYQQEAYNGQWDGRGSPPGVYFYYLRLNKVNRHFRGWVQVMKPDESNGREN